MEAGELAQKARKSISKFCFTECHAYCCRKGYIYLTSEQVPLIDPENKNSDIIHPLKSGEFKMNIGLRGCPALDKQFKCEIYKSEKRPKICAEFPLKLYPKKVAVCKTCPAVEQGKLYPYLDQFVRMGYSIVYF